MNSNKKRYVPQSLIPIVTVGLGSKNKKLNEAVKKMFENDLIAAADFYNRININLLDRKLEFANDNAFRVSVAELEGKFYQKLFEEWASEIFNIKDSTPDLEIFFVEPDATRTKVVDAWRVAIASPQECSSAASSLKVMAVDNRPDATLDMYFSARVTTGPEVRDLAVGHLANYLNRPKVVAKTPAKRPVRKAPAK